MDVFHVLSLVGGLALFLYGMSTMGDGLVKLSGGKLERILEKLTTNRFAALFLGAAVTAIIQSSSATTVMVVGFVNSGIMALKQAVGVIMGANIGTTVTSWILSLTGIQGDNLLLSLLKPSSFSPILAAIGVILMMMKDKTGAKSIRKNVGVILVGFAILMTGMDSMAGSVSGLADNPKFTGLLITFSHPLWGLLAGMVLTVIVQSSSASIGILQALCATGVIPYGTALPIILGQNVGTCVTALLSSIGANKNARRASLIHLYFNLVGTLLFLTVFYFVNSIVHFSFLSEPANLAGVAVIHSCFNIGCAIALLPCADLLVKLSTWSIPDKKNEEQSSSKIPAALVALDDRFLERPAYAIGLCCQAVEKMAKMSKEAFILAENNLRDYSPIKASRVIELEEQTDVFEDVLGTYLTKLTGRTLSRNDSRLQSIMLHSINDLERIADHSANIVELAGKLRDNRLSFTAEALAELKEYGKALHDILNETVRIFEADPLLTSQNIAQAKKIEPLEEVVDDLYREMKKRHIDRLLRGVCSKEAGPILIDLIRNYERVSDHCAKIAVCMIEIDEDAYATHKYHEKTAKGSDPSFQKEYQRLSDIYLLPPVNPSVKD